MDLRVVSTEKPRGIREQKKVVTREKILRAARKRFFQDGYEATGLRDIATDIDMTTGAIFVHFSGKQELFMAVAIPMVELHTHAIQTAMLMTGDLKHRVVAVCEADCVFFHAHQPLLVGMEVLRREEDKQATILLSYRQEMVQGAVCSLLDGVGHDAADQVAAVVWYVHEGLFELVSRGLGVGDYRLKFLALIDHVAL